MHRQRYQSPKGVRYLCINCLEGVFLGGKMGTQHGVPVSLEGEDESGGEFAEVGGEALD